MYESAIEIVSKCPSGVINDCTVSQQPPKAYGFDSLNVYDSRPCKRTRAEDRSLYVSMTGWHPEVL